MAAWSLGAMALLVSGTSTVAQRNAAERAECGSRLEIDEFRNDLRNQSPKKAAPVLIAPNDQSAIAKSKEKNRKK